MAVRARTILGQCLPAATAAIMAGACGVSAQHSWLNKPPRPMVPRPAETVDVYASGPPSAPHVDVAIIEAGEYDFGSSTLNDVVTALRAQAARLGCDVIRIGDATNRRSGTATCAMYTDRREHVSSSQ
jgi:hypothetical protein